MNKIHSYYLIGFILFSAILNEFLGSESIGVKLLYSVLLITTFVFASLFHSLKVRVARDKKTSIK
ncbi:conserved hypothetical protein [Alteromonas sp. 38]|nr:conserved hypothetical protein [Alteromonas sp. 154]VXB92175.1 conserved hypothetical protein [Alteromonas sp. 38]